MNFTQLSEAIQAYAETTEQLFVDNIPNFIQLAEERIYNAVQIPAIRKNVIGTFTDGDCYLALPNDYLASFSLAVIDSSGNYKYLLDKDVNFIRESYPSASTQDEPQYYAIFGPQSNDLDELTFILGPTPDANYSVELHYFYYPESIVTAGTSWLGDNFDTALLYGALVEAYTYMKGEADVIAQYDKQYQNALGLLKMLGDGKDRRDAYRNGQVRDQVV